MTSRACDDRWSSRQRAMRQGSPPSQGRDAEAARFTRARGVGSPAPGLRKKRGRRISLGGSDRWQHLNFGIGWPHMATDR
jgi:hypothetical protein